MWKRWILKEDCDCKCKFQTSGTVFVWDPRTKKAHFAVQTLRKKEASEPSLRKSVHFLPIWSSFGLLNQKEDCTICQAWKSFCWNFQRPELQNWHLYYGKFSDLNAFGSCGCFMTTASCSIWLSEWEKRLGKCVKIHVQLALSASLYLSFVSEYKRA